MRSTLKLAQRIVNEYETGKAKDKARGHHRLDGAVLTDEVRLAQAVVQLYNECVVAGTPTAMQIDKELGDPPISA